MSCRAKIQDAQPLMRKADRPMHVDPRIIRSAVAKTGTHGCDPLGHDWLIVKIDLSGDSTHGVYVSS